MRQAKSSGASPESMHACVDLEPDHKSVRAAIRFEHLDLIERVHHDLELVSAGRLEILRAYHAFEQHQRMIEARVAQNERLIEARQTEGVGAREGARAWHESMTVGVRLDRRQHARLRRQASHHCEVVAQRLAADRRTGEIHAKPLAFRPR